MNLRLCESIRGERFAFADLRDLFARANEAKSGDALAGLAARSDRERVAAKRVLAEVTLREIVEHPLIDPDDDEVSRLILDTLDGDAFAAIAGLAVGEFRDLLLDDATGGRDAARSTGAITPEVAAAVAKMMSNKDLVAGREQDPRSSRGCRNTMGEAGCSASASSRTTRPTTSAASCSRPSTACSSAAATR